MVEKVTVAEFHARLKSQGVSNRNHSALACPICGTVQSMASLVRAGADPERAERMVGFSCEGRLTGAGPAAASSDKRASARKRRLVRGCDWTLGGLFSLHELEVVTEDGAVHPRFRIATQDEALALEAAALPRAA